MLNSNDQVLTVAQMRAAEEVLINSGSSVEELMERAGGEAAEIIWRMSAGRTVTILCGPGNNGGDGYVIARHLRERGLTVTVIAPFPPKTDAAKAALVNWDGEVLERAESVSGGIFVDCLFGSGLSRPLAPELITIIVDLADRHELAVAVDVPSGVDVDNGMCSEFSPQYDCTVALGAWKFAHFDGPAALKSRALRWVDIGIEDQNCGAFRMPRPVLDPPLSYAHKYSRGLLAVIAGQMPGASILAARAAMRTGAGYVKLATKNPPTAILPSLVYDSDPLETALADSRIDALLVGQGLGLGDESRSQLRCVLELRKPCVVDGDALRLLDHQMMDVAEPESVIITPHHGELQALCENFGIPEAAHRAQVEQLHKVTGMTVIAKGPSTHIHGQAELNGSDIRTGLFRPGSSWLSVAGSGDVLAGIVASRLAVGSAPFDAASQGVWIHNEAARLCGTAFTADDLADAVGPAFRSFL